MVTLICSFLCFLIGLISCMMSIRYGTCTKRANKLPNKGKGTIISVIEEHGFDASFTAVRGSAGTKEPGIGGIWQIFFMLWNEIRPDCWFPVILYHSNENIKESATLLYGCFKTLGIRTKKLISLGINQNLLLFILSINNGFLKKYCFMSSFLAYHLCYASHS